MKSRHVLALAATLSLTLAAGAAFAATTPMTKAFVDKATIGSQFEIQSSQVALEKTQNPDIRAFAQQMIDDHGKAAQELNSTISAAQVDGPSSTDLDKAHQAKLDKLNALPAGPAFDKAYIDAQKGAHKEAVTLFAKYAKKGDNDNLKGYAAETLPTLQEHQAHVKMLKAM